MSFFRKKTNRGQRGHTWPIYELSRDKQQYHYVSSIYKRRVCPACPRCPVNIVFGFTQSAMSRLSPQKPHHSIIATKGASRHA